MSANPLPGNIAIDTSELDALPQGSVVIDALWESWTKGDDGWYWCWYDFGDEASVVPLPATVVWVPTPDQTPPSRTLT